LMKKEGTRKGLLDDCLRVIERRKGESIEVHATSWNEGRRDRGKKWKK